MTFRGTIFKYCHDNHTAACLRLPFQLVFQHSGLDSHSDGAGNLHHFRSAAVIQYEAGCAGNQYAYQRKKGTLNGKEQRENPICGCFYLYDMLYFTYF